MLDMWFKCKKKQDVEHFVNLQKEIKLSGLPNYMGCRIPVVKFEPRIYKMNVSTLRGQDIVWVVRISNRLQWWKFKS